jgi:hypothetical protein
MGGGKGTSERGDKERKSGRWKGEKQGGGWGDSLT